MWSKVAVFLVFQSVQNTAITPNANLYFTLPLKLPIQAQLIYSLGNTDKPTATRTTPHTYLAIVQSKKRCRVLSA
mgnify:CR=1 FL=1